MTRLAIRADRLSKRYHIGRDIGRYEKLTEAISEGLSTRLSRRNSERPHEPEGTLWALRDVSLDVHEGEVLGVVGRNGAGKSTLLKILARITDPTSGRAEIYGRVGSLLEVGTGFHPELTGRENVFLNGAILGMRRAEIRRKFDDIVAFAEVERFIDTPIKRYSSGMYVRLAFAVAAHLEPEILIIDEVLAVGDAAFQKKCLGKIGDVAREGRTVLFISHNATAVERLCTRCVLLEGGRLTHEGPPLEVIRAYMKFQWRSLAEWRRPAGKPRESDVAFERVRTVGRDGRPLASFGGDEPIRIELEFAVQRRLPHCQIGIRVVNAEGIPILTSADSDEEDMPALPREPGNHLASVELPARLLPPGSYSVLVAAHSPMQRVYEVLEDVVSFQVTAAGSLVALDQRLGAVSPVLSWEASLREPQSAASPGET